MRLGYARDLYLKHRLSDVSVRRVRRGEGLTGNINKGKEEAQALKYIRER